MEKGWVKIFSETYNDCIVGDADGLKALKESIDQALESDSSDINNHCQADFDRVVLTNEKWDQSEAVEVPKWQGYLFQIILFVWCIALPLLGIAFLYKQATS